MSSRFWDLFSKSKTRQTVNKEHIQQQPLSGTHERARAHTHGRKEATLYVFSAAPKSWFSLSLGTCVLGKEHCFFSPSVVSHACKVSVLFILHSSFWHLHKQKPSAEAYPELVPELCSRAEIRRVDFSSADKSISATGESVLCDFCVV